MLWISKFQWNYYQNLKLMFIVAFPFIMYSYSYMSQFHSLFLYPSGSHIYLCTVFYLSMLI
jgi:hypothetical protein